MHNIERTHVELVSPESEMSDHTRTSSDAPVSRCLSGTLHGRPVLPRTV